MILDVKSKNRCVVFLFYDKDGIVDQYVLDMLDDLRENAAFVYVAVNGVITPEGRARLARHSDEVFCRVNAGFDVGGYRDAIFNLGFRELAKYDELVLMNYTFFAPLYPFREMFETMNPKDLDFWGITKHHTVPGDPYDGKIVYGYLPEHLNSHFFALRRDFFLSWSYRDFICNMKNPGSYLESITQYEVIFTKHFADLNYKWAAYADSDRFEGTYYAPFMFAASELIEEDRCPIVKRRTFFSDYQFFLLNTAGECSYRAYEAIKKLPGVRTRPIWENILRLQNLPDIRQVVHLTYLVDSEFTRHTFSPDDEAAVFVFCEPGVDRELVAGRYLRKIPDTVRVIYMDGPETYAEKLIAASMQAEDYFFVGVLNLFDVRKAPEPKSDAASLLYREEESVIGSAAQIGNILDEMKEERALGLLVPPVPSFGRYFAEIGDGWTGLYDELLETLKLLKMTFPVTKTDAHPAFPYGGSFWARGKALMRAGLYLRDGRLAELVRDPDKQLLIRLLLPFLMQEERYLTGIVTGSKYAAIEFTNQDYMLRVNNRMVFEKFGPDYYEQELKKIRGKA